MEAVQEDLLEVNNQTTTRDGDRNIVDNTATTTTTSATQNHITTTALRKTTGSTEEEEGFMRFLDVSDGAGPSVPAVPVANASMLPHWQRKTKDRPTWAPDGPETLAAEKGLIAQGEVVERRNWAAAIVLVGWMVTSITTLLFHKHLFSGGRFPYPLTLLLTHQCFAAVLLNGVQLLAPRCIVQRVMPASVRGTTLKQWMQSFLLIGIFQAVSMATQNMALQLVSTHFVIMLSATKPALVAIFQVSIGLAPFNLLQLKVLLCVGLGVSVAVAGEGQLEWDGFVYLVLAQVTEAWRIILMQKVFGDTTREMDALTMLSLSSPACLAILLPAAYLSEIQFMDSKVFENSSLSGVGISTFLAFGVNLISAQVVKSTSAIALVLLGVVKDFTGIFVSAWLFSARLSPVQVLGYAAAVGFINSYREIKKNEAAYANAGLVDVTVRLLLPHDCQRQVFSRRALMFFVVCLAGFTLVSIGDPVWDLLALEQGVTPSQKPTA
ncbi:unnamed protein product, partial [Polarella glacialis]